MNTDKTSTPDSLGAAHGSETGSTLTNSEQAECWLLAAVDANRNQDPIAAAKLAAGAISYLLLKERSPNDEAQRIGGAPETVNHRRRVNAPTIRCTVWLGVAAILENL